MKYVFLSIVICLSCLVSFAQKQQWINKLYDIECGLDRFGNINDYIILHKDGTFELSISQCNAGRSGGENTILKGKYQKISTYELKMVISEPFSFQCSSGYAMKLSKTFILTYNTLNNRSVVITKGMQIFAFSSPKYPNSRFWDEARFGYYFQ